MTHYLIAAAMSLLALGCNDSKKLGQDSAAYSSVTLDQGGCFGTCPVYEMSVMADGSAVYEGKRYAPYKGLHLGTVQSDSLAILRTRVGQVLAKADELPREMKSNIADASSARITIVTTAGDTLEYQGTTEFAKPVEALLKSLHNVAKGIAWQRSPDAEPLPPSELLLTLGNADDFQEILESYYRQQMRLERKVSADPATFLVSFDPYTMSAEEMVRDLKMRKQVQKVAVVENK